MNTHYHRKLKAYCFILITCLFIFSECDCLNDNTDTPSPGVCDSCPSDLCIDCCPSDLCETCSCSDGSSLSDEFFVDQWHLDNTGQSGGASGEDINVLSVWNSNIKGDTVLIAIIDDGLDYAHEDLAGNVIVKLNYNYITGSSLINSGDHGTAVAGAAAARGFNGIGVRGVAPCAFLTGYNLLQYSTNITEHNAMIRNKNFVGVSNNSWGPEDYTGQLTPPTSLWQEGIEEGVNTGRNGLGIIYTWAAGNGGTITPSPDIEIDNSNYDGYANFYGVMAVGSVDSDGIRSYYSEKGANIWICAPAHGIYTTDVSESDGYTSTNYNESFAGTSAAAPVASGVIALILRANPNLSWRDVKLILAETARKNDSGDSDWTTNNAGYNINHKYGFGVTDAAAAVAAASDWTNVGELETYTKSETSIDTSIPDNNSTGIISNISITSSGITNIEYVAITIEITHPYSGDLEITLSSSSGTTSILSEKHNCHTIYNSTLNQADCNYFDTGDSFTFGSAHHLGESADGTWKLTVKDMATSDAGTLNSWGLKFYGR